MALCEVEDVKVFLRISDEDKDDLIETLIPPAQVFIETFCGQNFAGINEVIEYFHGGTDRFVLKQYPIIMDNEYYDPLSVYLDTNRQFGDETLVDSSDYFLDTDCGIIYFDYELGKTYGSLKVVYAAGYGENVEAIPVALKQVCIEMVARKLKIGTTGDVGLISKGTPGGVSIVFSQADLLPEHKLILESFKR
jgi:uncharacterized phiE125 gp8 family phage protein